MVSAFPLTPLLSTLRNYGLGIAIDSSAQCTYNLGIPIGPSAPHAMYLWPQHPNWHHHSVFYTAMTSASSVVIQITSVVLLGRLAGDEVSKNIPHPCYSFLWFLWYPNGIGNIYKQSLILSYYYLSECHPAGNEKIPHVLSLYVILTYSLGPHIEPTT